MQNVRAAIIPVTQFQQNCTLMWCTRTMRAVVVDPGGDLPRIRRAIAEVLSPTNPLGIKAGGEGGTTAAPAVMVSAILDALGELGVRDITMPATPHKVWTAIREAKARAGKD